MVPACLGADSIASKAAVSDLGCSEMTKVFRTRTNRDISLTDDVAELCVEGRDKRQFGAPRRRSADNSQTYFEEERAVGLTSSVGWGGWQRLSA